MNAFDTMEHYATDSRHGEASAIWLKMYRTWKDVNKVKPYNEAKLQRWTCKLHPNDTYDTFVSDVARSDNLGVTV
jgi:hypothetical protein